MLAASAAASTTSCMRHGDQASVGDVSRMGRIEVDRIARPGSAADIQKLLQTSREPVSIAGAGYSMGGQIAAPGSLHLDMAGMNRVVGLDTARRIVRVQAGMRWRDLQDVLDPHDLAIRIMQSYSNFSVGGSVSVNCHGRYVGAGPLAHSIRTLQLVTADGRVRELDRGKEPELFAAAIGGYGGLGVITEVELDLATNEKMARHAERIPLQDYPRHFLDKVQGNPDLVMHNADLAPPCFDQPLAISWVRSDAPLTETRRLLPRKLDYSRQQNLIWSASELPMSEELRDRYLTDRILDEKPVVMRNFEASQDTASLEPRTRMVSTYLLQEYFIPIAAFLPFAKRMAEILRMHEVNALNVSIRHSPADTVSLLRWAPAEVFSFVLYYKQRSTGRADRVSERWTRLLIDAALAMGGRYYLPYRLHASAAQFHAAYPELPAFASIKGKVDPDYRFRNLLWDKYLPRI